MSHCDISLTSLNYSRLVSRRCHVCDITMTSRDVMSCLGRPKKHSAVELSRCKLNINIFFKYVLNIFFSLCYSKFVIITISFSFNLYNNRLFSFYHHFLYAAHNIFCSLRFNYCIEKDNTDIRAVTCNDNKLM